MAKNKVLNISQSTIKLVRDYENGSECGLVVEKLITKEIDSLPSKKMNEGSYFEYLLFGTLKRDGSAPKPDYMVSSLKDLAKRLKTTPDKLTDDDKAALGIPDMLAPYRAVHAAAERTRTFLKKMGLKTIAINKRYEKDGMSGLIDAELAGRILEGEAVIDTKYTGLINDKWSDYGWSFERENQIEHHAIQARQYHLITGKPMYYLVVENKEFCDIRFYKAKFTELGLEQHKELVASTRSKIETNNAIGWAAKPELKRCESCVLRDNCNHRAWHPSIIEIEF